MSEILDSGERTEFQTGAVRDMHEGKGRFDLLPVAFRRDGKILCGHKRCLSDRRRFRAFLRRPASPPAPASSARR